MQLFYTPDIETDSALPSEEAAHCARVLRLQVGEQVRLTDGKGSFYTAELQEVSKRQVRVKVLHRTPWKKGWPRSIHLAIAPTKNMDRMEWLVEKATEIGLDEFSFLNCRHSERKVLKLERLHKIGVSAMKQSLKARLPQLNEMKSFKEFIREPRPGGKWIAHCHAAEKPLLKEVIRPGETATLLIGPEGDFSPEEVELALSHGYQAVSLGESRLRTETAALVGVVLMNS